MSFKSYWESVTSWWSNARKPRRKIVSATGQVRSIGTVSSVSVTIYNPDTTAPSVPTGLTATGGTQQVSLSCNASSDPSVNGAATSGLAGYKWYVATTPTGTYSLLTTTAGTSYTHTGLGDGATRYYKVSAYDNAGNESAQSSYVSATTSQPSSSVYAGYTPTVVVTTAAALRSALQTATAGAVIGVDPGAHVAYWSETLASHKPIWRTTNSGTNGNPIRVVAKYPAALYPSQPDLWTELRNGRIENPSTVAYGFPAFGVYNQSDVEWIGFYTNGVNSPTSPDWGQTTLNGATRGAIKYCRIVGAGAPYGPTDELYNGIRMEASSNVYVGYNYLTNFWSRSVGNASFNGSAIELDNTAGGTVEHNEVYYCGCGIGHKRADQVGGSGSNPGNWIVRYNYIHDCVYGIRFDSNVPVGGSGYYANIYQNLVTGALLALGISNSSNDDTVNIRYQNNTVVAGAGTHDAGAFTNMTFSAGAGNKFWNNIYSGVEHGHYWDYSAATSFTPEQLDSQHNVYHNVTGAFWYWHEQSRTYATWTGNSVEDEDPVSITSDPLFVGGGSYKLQAGSPALALGRDLLGLSGTVGATIPAGCYITGNEVIGIQ